ncbi:MAG: glycosyltransferase family 4 protein [Oscillospiraceae bacterium]|nr:glycosyltransferase family 4 protein [Oscillospiraceae bacterium]
MAQKVLFTASTYSHIRNFHLPYMGQFHSAGWEIHVACGDAPGAIFYTSQVITLPFEKKMTSPSNFRASRLLRRKMEQEQYDLVITHTSLAAFFTRLAIKGLKKRPRVINMSHGYLFDDSTRLIKRALLLRAERMTARCTDLVLTMNQYDFRIARKYKLGKQVVNIPGIGVDFSHLRKPSRVAVHELRQKLNLKAGDFVLVYAAEFSSRKSQSVLIRALPLLPKPVILLLPGNGALLEDCKKLAEKLGVSDRVRFPGHVDNMALWYSISDVAVTSSRSEGLPFNVMESMYMGLPVVASAVKGHEDLISDGETGFLYPYGNYAACADRILKLYESPILCEVMGQAAQHAVQPYALEHVLPLVMEQYGVPVSADEEDEVTV